MAALSILRRTEADMKGLCVTIAFAFGLAAIWSIAWLGVGAVNQVAEALGR